MTKSKRPNSIEPKQNSKNPTKKSKTTSEPKSTKKKATKDIDESHSNDTKLSFNRNSEQSSRPENNTETEHSKEKHNDNDFKTALCSLPAVYPLTTKRDDIELTMDRIEENISTNSREVSFKANYKAIPVLCTCVITAGDINFHNQKNEHEWEMSERLRICRNMATYLGKFEAYPIELGINFLKSTKAKKEVPALFFIKPYFENGTLKQYLKERKKNNLELEPLYVLQMAVTLFSILSDAHSQQIGLVDISTDSLYVNTDGGLYFSGFKYCVLLNSEDSNILKNWLDFNSIKCPETKILRTGKYLKESDVFLACSVLLQIIQKDFGQYTRLYKQSVKEAKVEIEKEHLDPKFYFLLPIIQEGLYYNYQERSSAFELLVAFESMRYKAILEAADSEI